MKGKKKELEAAPENTGKVENKFSKEQLITSKRFRNRRDLVEALLDDGQTYTVKAVEEKITSYMKGKVK
jgi:hypothetical protein